MRKIVTTNGCFDILHPGHIEMLRQAKSYGDYLIVCMNSDASVRRLKGAGRPIHNQDYRKKMLESIRYVDEVRIFGENSPNRILGKIKPRFHVKSREGYKGLEKGVVENNGGRIVLINDIPGYSSTKEMVDITRRFVGVIQDE